MERWSRYVGVVDLESLVIHLERVAFFEEVRVQGDDFPMERPVERGYSLVLGGPPFLRFHKSALRPSRDACLITRSDRFGSDDGFYSLFFEFGEYVADLFDNLLRSESFVDRLTVYFFDSVICGCIDTFSELNDFFPDDSFHFGISHLERRSGSYFLHREISFLVEEFQIGLFEKSEVDGRILGTVELRDVGFYMFLRLG